MLRSVMVLFLASALPGSASAADDEASRARADVAFAALERGDYAAAVGLFEQACADGEVWACTNLGLMYKQGTGVPADPARAVELYELSCDAGDGNACFNLGLSYRQGSGVEAQPARAAELFRRACDIGEAVGCANLAEALWHGDGVVQDRAKAIEFYRLAQSAAVEEADRSKIAARIDQRIAELEAAN